MMEGVETKLTVIREMGANITIVQKEHVLGKTKPETKNKKVLEIKDRIVEIIAERLEDSDEKLF